MTRRPSAANPAAEARRLLVVRPTLGQGGADRMTLLLLETLDRKRFEPELALFEASGEWLARVPEDVQVHDLGGASLWTAWLPLIGILRTQSPDIAFSTSSGGNLALSLAHLLANSSARLVLSERAMQRPPRTWKRALQLLAKKILYPRADAVTAVSPGVRRELIDRLGLPSDRVIVTFNPVVEERLAALAASPPAHPWFEEEIPVILAAGRLVPIKDFGTLLRAFARLRAQLPARLLILGEGPERPELLRLAAELEVAHEVDLPGFDPNPFAYMSRCAVFALTSLAEGLPGVLIQAMACGAAVVATDCPTGPREVIEPGTDGLLVPVGDDRALCEALSRILLDPELRTRLGRAAKESSAQFRPSQSLPLYERALGGDS